MGDDFRNHQVSTTAEDRSSVIQVIRTYLAGAWYVPSDECEFGRSIAVGPPTLHIPFLRWPGINWIPFLHSPGTNWIAVLDSTGTIDDDVDAFRSLTAELSRHWPTVDIEMSDSAALSLSLYNDGELLDEYRNLRPPFYLFSSEEEAARYRGKPDLWAKLFDDSNCADKLRASWRQGRGSWADAILSETAAILGWHPYLCQVGYTIDYDGCPVRYQEHYKDDQKALSGIEELHFTIDRRHS